MGVLRWLVKKISIVVPALVMLVLTLLNLAYSNVFGEMCGYLHPIVFQIETAQIDVATAYLWSSPETSLPVTDPPADLSISDPDFADLWESCVEYYGYVGRDGFIINVDGINRHVIAEDEEADTLEDIDLSTLVASVALTDTGKIMLYLLLPSLVIVLPIVTIYFMRREWGIVWFVMLILVASHVLSSSLLYTHLSDVSGVVTLAEFAYGIFGGTATGTAIAFMTKMLENFSADSRAA